MTDQSRLPQSSESTAVHGVATRPRRTAERKCVAGRRDLLALIAASGLAISTWAVFPSTVESGIYVPIPEASTSFVGEINSAVDAIVGDPVNAARWINANLLAPKPARYGSVTLRYPTPMIDIGMVPLRSKLQALLMMIYFRSGDVDPAALEVKLQALLKLPDSVLAEVMEHPDLAVLEKMLDAVFLGTSDLSGVETELGKIEVTSVPGTSDQVRLIKINGEPARIVHSPAVNEGVEPLASPTGEEMMMASQLLGTPDGVSASAFRLAPSSEEFAPPTALTSLSTPAFTLAPSSAESTSPPMPAPAAISTAATPTASVEPSGAAQTSQDVMASGNKFEPGQTVSQGSAGSSPAPQPAEPSLPATGGEEPAETGGVTGDGGATSPSDNESGGTPSGEAASP